MRVYELARQLNLTSKELLAQLRKAGIAVKSHSSSLSEDEISRVKGGLLSPPPPAPEAEVEEAVETVGEKKEEATPPEKEEEKTRRVLPVKFPLTVRELADHLGQKPNLLIKKLLQNGIFASLNQFLDEETAILLAHDYDYDLVPHAPLRETAPAAPVVKAEAPVREEAEKLRPRAPVVTLMGHIDHGKTTILDYIRHSRITSREAGGITQHIGAYRVKLEEGSIVFLDTPGHEAFTTMRARGARLTDIVILVIAADDGVMPQTLEAIDHARAAGVPIIVAINKIDKAAAEPDKVKRQLAEREMTCEDMGGETICVEVSGTTGEGLNSLLEMILLQAEIMELKANPEGPARGMVVEAKLTSGRGPVVTVLIKSGTLKEGDNVVCEKYAGRIKAIFDDRGRALKEAGPATPVEVLGIVGVPPAGSTMEVVESEAVARRLRESRRLEAREISREEISRVTLNDFLQRLAEGDARELRLILKGDVQGSVEALSALLRKLSSEKLGLKIIHEAVGTINESDVMLASASGAVIIGFQVGAESKVKRMAKAEGVDIRSYDIIYQAVDEVTKAMTGLLPPKIKEISLGEARILQLFNISKVGQVAGSMVEKGKLRKGDQAKIRREGEVVATDKIVNLKRFKDSAEEVAAGQECGIGLGNFRDLQVGDIIESFEITKIPQEL